MSDASTAVDGPTIGRCKFCSLDNLLTPDGRCTDTGMCVYRYSNRLRHADETTSHTGAAWTIVGYHEDDFPESLRARYQLEQQTAYHRNTLLLIGVRATREQMIKDAQHHADTLASRVIVYEHHTNERVSTFWSAGDEYSLIWTLKHNDARSTILFPAAVDRSIAPPDGPDI